MKNGEKKSDVRSGLLKHIQVKNMSAGTLSEKVQGLPGTLYLERRENGTIEGYFRYTAPGGSRRKRKIGTYRLTDGGGGMTLVQMRDKAKELAQVAKDHGDIEEFFAAEAEQAARAKSDAERLQAIESSMGTFTELFKDFIESRKGVVQPKQIVAFENYLKGDLIKPFPDIMSMKAKDAPINLSCSRGKLQFSRHPQRHWTKSDRKIMYGELFRPVLRVKREPHPYP